MNINDINKISKRIITIGGIQVKHYIKIPTTDKFGKKFPYINTYKGGGMALPTCYVIQTSDAIILESVISDSERKDGIRTISVYLSYNDIMGLKNLFDEGYRWFTDPSIKNELFSYTKEGKPYKISEKYTQLNYLINLKNSLLQGAYLCVQPAIVTDTKNIVTYPGVIFKCVNGILGMCTMEEFMNLRTLMDNLMTNLYQNSLLLINNALMASDDK